VARDPRIGALDRVLDRTENEWPIARTEWTKLYIDPEAGTLSDTPAVAPTQASFDALKDGGITMSTPPLERETEITGPVAAKLFVSSSTSDADLFLVLRVFDPEGNEVVLQGAVDPHTPIGHGWLRASHRDLDHALTTPYRPYHTHDEIKPLAPGEVCELDIEIWPTSIVVPRGYRVALTVRGKDYEFEGPGDDVELGHFKGSKMRGVAIYTHANPKHRCADVYGGRTTLHAGPDHRGYVLLPVIPTIRNR
jgi:predicted acyl esterase